SASFRNFGDVFFGVRGLWRRFGSLSIIQPLQNHPRLPKPRLNRLSNARRPKDYQSDARGLALQKGRPSSRDASKIGVTIFMKGNTKQSITSDFNLHRLRLDG